MPEPAHSPAAWIRAGWVWLVVVTAWTGTAGAQIYTLQDVVDSRTLTVLAPSGELETVRMIGIAQQGEGDESQARRFAETLLRDNERLELEFDGPPRDAQGRLLAYVWMVHRRDSRWLAVNRISMPFTRAGLTEYWRTDGDDGLQYRCLNAEMIRSGMARPAPQPTQTRYLSELQSLYQAAAERQRQAGQVQRLSGIH